MSGIDQSLPWSLLQRMNDDREIDTFQTWYGGYYERTTGTSLPIKPVYDKKASCFVQKLELTEGADGTSELRAAIQRYRDTAGGRWADFDPDSCSWSHVFQELNEAKNVYEGLGAKSRIRRAFRHGSGISRNITPLLDGIPQEDGLGLIKGGLKILFNAIKRRSDTCKRILETFESIPDDVAAANRLRQTHPQDGSLGMAIRRFYDELIRCIPLLIDVLLRRSNEPVYRKAAKTIFADSLDEVGAITKPLIDSKKKLQDCRDALDTECIARTLHHSRSTREDVKSASHSIDNLDAKITHLGGQVTQLDSRMTSWAAENQRIRDEYINKKDIREIIEVMNSHYIMMTESRRVGWHQARHNQSIVGSKSMTETEELMDALCTTYERTAPTRDLGYVVKQHHNFHTKGIARANYLITTSQFQSWLTDRDSNILLVDGHCGEESTGRIAPTSILCAGLIEALSNPSIDSALAFPDCPRTMLHFFAGQHVMPNNTLRGPYGLIRSLVDQLLFNWPDQNNLPDLRFLEGEPSKWVSEHGSQTTNLCRLFERLVLQLRSDSSIYCIIDGVSYFETQLQGWADDLGTIVECFLRCIDGTRGYKGACAVKFLLVSADKSTRIWNRIPSSHHVDLRAGNLHAQSRVEDALATGIMEAGYQEEPRRGHMGF